MQPSLYLSGLLKASVPTNVMLSHPVQTEVVRKFTGSTGIGIYPSATEVTGCVELDCRVSLSVHRAFRRVT